MQKVIVWGTGNTYRINLSWIKRQEELGKIEIIALVNKSEERIHDGYNVIRSNDIACLEFDLIIVCAEGQMAADIYNEIELLGIDSDRVCCIEDYIISTNAEVAKLHNDIVDRQINVIKEILMAEDYQIRDEKWMRERICEYGVYPFEDMRNLTSIIGSEAADKGWGVLQIPEEFAGFLCKISELEIETAAEVGVFKGRSSYLMCAVLSRTGKLKDYLCIDIYDNLDCFDRFASVLPALKKKIPSTSIEYIGCAFDFVFIDADHSYDGSIDDYNNIGKYAKKITAFHDIYGHEYDHLNGGTVRTWREVMDDTPGKKHIVFSKYPDEWMGIGAVIWDEES
mgnify:CR=1 FL=1